MADVSTRRNRSGTPEPRSAPALTPVVRATTTADLVVASIRDAILSGRLQPGETLVERRLAEQLGVSKTPVREALITLSAAGLVTGSPNRGCVVREPDAGEIRQAYELRGLIEPWAVARTVRRARDEAVDAARAALAEADELLAGGERRRTGRSGGTTRDPAGTDQAGPDLPALSVANRRFHRALYAGCDNRLVVAHLDAGQELAALGAVAVLWARQPTWRDEHAQHHEILAAAEDGAADLAERLVRRHIRQSLQRL
jgi:DNA-binding GntR family transcriptional regulator